MDEKTLSTKNDASEKFWLNSHLEFLTWMSKSCVYHRCLWDHIDVPKVGTIAQLGVGVGLSLEILNSKFPNRTIGFDIYNPADHPAVKLVDVRELEDMPLAYVYCNVGNFDKTPAIRRIGLEWSLKNLLPGGYCCTAGNHEYVENFLGFTISDLAKDYGCSVIDMPDDPLIEKMNTLGKFDSMHDCLIYKNAV